jgi:hypothetical protein
LPKQALSDEKCPLNVSETAIVDILDEGVYVGANEESVATGEAGRSFGRK